MPFYVRQLLDGRREPITITADQSTKQAWDLMNQHGFSQLPVVGPDSKPIGIVTSDSILRALVVAWPGITEDALERLAAGAAQAEMAVLL